MLLNYTLALVVLTATVVGALLAIRPKTLRDVKEAMAAFAPIFFVLAVAMLIMLAKYVAYKHRHPDAAFWTFFF